MTWKPPSEYAADRQREMQQAQRRVTLPGGFLFPAGPENLRMEKLIDRALLTLVISLTPGYLSPGGVPRIKTRKAREIERAELQALLRLMVNDFGIRTGEGYTETALEWRLCELAVERGLLTHHPEKYPVFRTHGEHANWSLWDVMTDERKDREHPGRRQPTAPLDEARASAAEYTRQETRK